MRVESAAELMAFFSPEEFGEEAILHTGTGDHPIVGIPDLMADSAKPGGIQNSSRSPFMTGVAEFTTQEHQFMTRTAAVTAAGAHLDDTLEITTGDYVGSYRVKDINPDGAVCRLLLNKL